MKPEILIVGFESLPLLINRDGALPARIHLVPRGELVNKAAGIRQVLDDKALNAIVANWKADEKERGENWPGVYMGEEHFFYNSDRSSEAFVWAREFEIDGKGIWTTKYDVTDVGEPALKNRRFKFTSFVTNPAVPGSVEKLGDKRYRILRVETVGFTNNANGLHLLTPVMNKNTFLGAGASMDGNEKTKTERTQTMKSIATQLKLSAEASEDAILAEVTKLQNRVTTLEPLEATNTTLKNRNTELETEQCESLLDIYQVKDAKARETLKPLLAPLKNRADRVTALTNLGHKIADTKKVVTPRILNREEAKGGAVEGEAAVVTEEMGALIKNRADELKGANPARRYEHCFAQAEQEVMTAKK